MLKTAITLGIVGTVGFMLVGGHDAETQARLDKVCFEKHGKNTTGANRFSDTLCNMTDEWKEAQELAKDSEKAKKAEEKRIAEEKKAEEKRLAEEARLAYKASPKGKTEEFMKWQATGHCKQYTINSAKFPTKVDFDWGADRNFWMNFNDSGDARVMIQFSGEMMNGLGMMIPFQSTCKYDFNPQTGSSKMIEFLL